jgi:hypothetical protein
LDGFEGILDGLKAVCERCKGDCCHGGAASS